MKKIVVTIAYDEVLDQIIFYTPGATTSLSAANDGPTWKAVGEGLVRDVKAFGRSYEPGY